MLYKQCGGVLSSRADDAHMIPTVRFPTLQVDEARLDQLIADMAGKVREAGARACLLHMNMYSSRTTECCKHYLVQFATAVLL